MGRFPGFFFMSDGTGAIGEQPPSQPIPPPGIKENKLPPVPPGRKQDEPPPGDPAKAKDAPGSVPETYALKFPEGVEPDKTLVASFSELAKAAKLSNEHAQALVDFHSTMESERKTAFEQWKQASLDEVKADPVLGGANFDATAKMANEALLKWDPKGEAAKLLIESGLANRKELVAMFVAIHKATADDNIAHPRAANPAGEKSLADRLFGKSKE